LKVVSGEWYGGKILEKILSVRMTKIYRLSYLTTNFVPSRIPNSWFTKLKNVKITFFKQKTWFSVGKYEKKIPEFLLDSMWYKFQNFSLKSRQMKKYYRNSENLKL